MFIPIIMTPSDILKCHTHVKWRTFLFGHHQMSCRMFGKARAAVDDVFSLNDFTHYSGKMRKSVAIQSKSAAYAPAQQKMLPSNHCTAWG
jgi:hypothetical protein